MYFQGLSVEILEDGKQLREYCLQAKNTITTTGKSYVIDEKTNERKYSPITVYAVVKEAGKKFEIKYSAKMASEDNPIIAIVYVDGTNDHVSRGITSSSPQIQNSFWNSSRDKKYYFKFSEIPSSPSLNKFRLKENNPINGARGTVSIYFYRGLKVPTRLTSVPHYTLNQSRMIEPKYKSEVRFTTQFEEAIDDDVSSKPIVDMIKQSNDPFAVLHIHYRSEPWLISIGMPINRDGLSEPVSTVNDQNEIVQSRKDNGLSEIGGTYVSLEKVRNVIDQLNQSIINLIGNLEINNRENLNKENTYTNVITPPVVDIIEIQDDDDEKQPNPQNKSKRQGRFGKKRKKEEPMTKRTKYKEYIEREYHTSDYIEFGDDDNGEQGQILKKTYCIEKTIINLDDSGDDE